jgi:hypothetical protein
MPIKSGLSRSVGGARGAVSRVFAVPYLSWTQHLRTTPVHWQRSSTNVWCRSIEATRMTGQRPAELL